MPSAVTPLCIARPRRSPFHGEFKESGFDEDLRAAIVQPLDDALKDLRSFRLTTTSEFVASSALTLTSPVNNPSAEAPLPDFFWTCFSPFPFRFRWLLGQRSGSRGSTLTPWHRRLKAQDVDGAFIVGRRQVQPIEQPAPHAHKPPPRRR